METTTEAELVDAVRAADADGEPLLVLGGGSNVLVADAGFDGVVVRDVRSGIEVPDASACAGATLTVPAGTPWDDVVRYAVEQELTGIETLAGIPGSTGATPVQNVGAYGQEVSQSIATVRVWDRGRGKVRTLPLVTLAFGYRTSLLKRSMRETDPADPQAPWSPTPRYVVLDVTFQLRPGTLSRPIAYAELARTLGVEVGGRAPLADVRDTVLALRARKGMVLDAADHDTWSAGSFFTNPFLQPRRGGRAAGRRAALPGRRRPREDQRGLAHRAVRVLARLRRPGPGEPVDQAHARADQPRGSEGRGPARPRASGARRRPVVLRGRAGARAGAGGRHALTPEQGAVHQHERLVVRQPRGAHG